MVSRSFRFNARAGLTSVLVGSMALGISVFPIHAQDEGKEPPPRGGNQADRGDRAEQFRARIMERFKTGLKATDEEWAVIQPLIEKVMEKQRESISSRMGGMMSRGGRRGPGGDQGGSGGDNGKSPADAGGDRGGDRRADRRGPGGGGSPEVTALREALDAPTPSVQDIKEKLTALREAKKKKDDELKQVRDELRQVLTLQQEATLVMMGILD